MEQADKRQLFLIANKYQKQIIQLVFLTTIVPIVMTVCALSFVFFDITSRLMMGGEQSIDLVKKIVLISLIILPCYIILMSIWSYKSSNRLTGPILRLIRELDEIIAGKEKHHLKVREKDYLKDLVERINSLIDKI